MQASSPHTHTATTVAIMMHKVLYALIPGILLSSYYFGIGIVVNCILASVSALLIETIIITLRQKAAGPAIKDGSTIVTAILFALTISPYTPWWITFTGIAFAVIIAKHLFGGLGNNPFNPAMAGYVFVLLSFPTQMVYWTDLNVSVEQTLTIGENIRIIFAGLPPDLDAITGATPLTNMKVELSLMNTVSEIETGPLYGLIGGQGWEWIALAYLAGGLFLIINKVIRWHIPVAVLGSLFSISLLFNFIDSDAYPSALYHLFTGGTILCAFFIATDPASSATTPKGKILYGIGVGCFIYIIRTWGSYPDGIAFSILIMNGLVPVLDYYTRPRALGET